MRKDMELRWPFAESATYLMSIGLDEDLDDAAKQAVREMVKHVWPFTSISPSSSMSIPTEIMLVQGAISTAGSAAECRMI